MEFKPKQAQSATQMYKQHLLAGDILKKDFTHPQVDIIPRTDIHEWCVRENVGRGGYPTMPRYDAQFKQALNELEGEGYIVTKTRCDMSGCCQYTAYIYYLEGE